VERTNVTGQYQSLDAARIVTTVEQLSKRIAARFPDAGLYVVCKQFLTTLESRVKRARALAMIHELRSIAHIIDMHQLTKDPERVMSTVVTTNVSPALPCPRLNWAATWTTAVKCWH